MYKRQLEGLTLPREQIATVLFGAGSDDGLTVQSLTVRALKLDVPGLVLPAFDVDATLSSSRALASATVASTDKTLTAKLDIKGANAQVELTGRNFKLPFGGIVQFEDFTGKGMVTASELVLTEFEGSALDGFLNGNARLRWGTAWSLEGELGARGINPALVTGSLVSSGRLEGRGAYSMRAATPDRLEATARLDGTFTVQKGALGMVDLSRVLQGNAGATGGNTLFSEMTGGVLVEGPRVQVRNIRLVAGLLSATGAAEVDAQKNLSGRFQVELRGQARSPLTLSGTVAAPVFRR